MSSDGAPVSEEDYPEVPAEAELVAESLQSEVVGQPGDSLWSRIRGVLGWGVDRRQRRLEDLFAAVAANPDSFTNYVMRGEVYLQIGEYELAASDFEIACKLAANHLAVDNWGVIAQAMQDRALVGLEQARSQLEKRRTDRV